MKIINGFCAVLLNKYMSSNIRLISRLDIKGPNLIKGVHFEGLRVLGDPNVYAKEYYIDGIDEILYIDSVASLYGRNNLSDILIKTVSDTFVPITAGGGLRNIEDVTLILRSGADKVAINTAAVKKPALISEVANKFGSQCMVLSIQAKKVANNKWEVYTENGREKTGNCVMEWLTKAIKLGAGEVLITSIDKDGTKNGCDKELVKAVSQISPIPVIASGGIGNLDDIEEIIQYSKADAVAMGSILHYKDYTINEIRDFLSKKNINVRTYENY
jgi:imidazole glycerol-phosphate synthase subunit HisF